MGAPYFEVEIIGMGHERFVARAVAPDGSALAEQPFAWRTNTLAFEEDLRHIERLAILPDPHDDFHITFGQTLYRAAFGGEVGELHRRQLVTEGQATISIRIDPFTAQPLARLPWELLHDGKAFLSLSARTAVVRLPKRLPVRTTLSVTGPLRLLVVVANPDDLPDPLRLDVEAERERILTVTDRLERNGRLEVTFLEDASLGAIRDALLDDEFHILHLTSHGAVDRATGEGMLLLEEEDGRRADTQGQSFVRVVADAGLRLVVLSACRTAAADQQGAFLDIGSQLALAGVPASIAMQHAIADTAATDFAEQFYRAIGAGNDLHQALARARAALAGPSGDCASLATPIAAVIDPLCLQTDGSSARSSISVARRGPEDYGRLQRMDRGFVGRSRELRRLRRNLASRDWIAAVLYGIGGIGKSALAARLAAQMLDGRDFGGVKVINCAPGLTADDVLAQLNAFLNLMGETSGNVILHQPVPLQSKTAVVAQLLNAQRVLVIFDNVEDCLIEGLRLSRAAAAAAFASDGEPNPTEFHDRWLGLAMSQLVGSANGAAYVFTSRIDFNPVEAGRITGRIGKVELPELSFALAAQLMNRQEPLASLPLTGVPDVLTKRWVHDRLGGHPWTINQFAVTGRNTSLQEARGVVDVVQRRAVAFTLVASAVAAQTERARGLLEHSAIYDQPVPEEGLAWMLGDERDCMPEVRAEVAQLRRWGLLTQSDGLFSMHALVRQHMQLRITDAARRELQRRAAGYWLTVGKESTSLEPYLFARDYLFAAGDYEPADDIVQLAFGYLRRWGQIEHLVALLAQSIRTTSGQRRAVAQGNLAIVYQGLGDYESARRMHEAVLHEFEQLGDRRNIANSLGQLGILHYLQGEYDRARERYEQALEIVRALGDQAGVASSLHQLGILHQDQGEYDRARERYEQSLEILRALGDQAGIARSLHQLAMLHQLQGEYDPARERYEQALEILRALGDQTGIAGSLHQLAMLHHMQGEYARARELTEQSLEIARALGDQVGIATSLHQLALLHQDQGEYDRAREFAEQSLGIARALGDQVGIARVLYQLGMLHKDQGEYARARELTEQALEIARALGNQSGIAYSLHQLGILHYLQGEYDRARELTEQALEIKRALGDQVGIATSSHQLGLLAEQQGDASMAVTYLVQAFVLFDRLGAPERETARRALARLREQIGEDAFEQALQSAQTNAGTPPASSSGGKPQAEGVQVIMANTVAVLTTEPGQKGAWWEALNVVRHEATTAGDETLAQIAALAQRVVEGENVETLAAEVPAEFANAWADLVRGVKGAK